MLTVTNAWTQRGWSPSDHLIDDSRIADMVGRTYRDLRSLRRAAERLADPRGYPTVEYHDGCRHYRYDGSPALPGRPVRVVQDLGPYCPTRARARIA